MVVAVTPWPAGVVCPAAGPLPAATPAPLMVMTLARSTTATLRTGDLLHLPAGKTATACPPGARGRGRTATSQVPGAGPPPGHEAVAQGRLVGPAEEVERIGAPVSHEHGITADAVCTKLLVDERAGEDF